MPLTRVVQELAPDFAQKQSSASDATAGRGLIVGAFGLGAQLVETETNLDLYRTNGNYLTPATGLTNLPPGWGQTRYLILVGGGISYTTQALYSMSTGLRATRHFSSTWSAWRIEYDTGNILGTVSQASGVPTGAIIERGSNAQGEYTKFADGTMICAGQLVASALAISTAYQGGFRSAGVSWTYPASFVAAPLGLTAVPHFDTAVSVLRNGFGSTTGNSIVLTAIASQAAADRTISLCAIGRWF